MAAEPAVQTYSAVPTSKWHNALFSWIQSDQRYQRLRPQFRHTLQSIANACSPDDSGNLVGAFGGQRLIERAGCGRSSFWRHVARLEKLGFVVTLSRGGTVNGRNYGNVYGIPIAPGALDERRCARRMQRMVTGDDGVRRPQVLEPGTQPTLWRPPTSGTAPPKEWDGGSPKVGRGPSQNGTVSSSVSSPVDEKNHGACARRNKSARLPHVDAATLADTGKLLDLHQEAASRGLVSAGEHGRLQFVSAAEHALALVRRDGHGDPCRVFASLVNCGHWLYVTQADEEAANRRLKAHLHGTTPPRAVERTPAVDPLAGLSPDARLVAQILEAAEACKWRGTPRELYEHATERSPPERRWSWEQWQAAMTEARQARRGR